MLRLHILHAVFIWILTNIIGSTVLWINDIIGLKLIEIIVLSLLFSLPAVIILVPNFFLFDFITERKNRITYAFLSTLALCAVVIICFLYFIDAYPVSESKLFISLVPYVLSAELSIFVVARKFILKTWASNH